MPLDHYVTVGRSGLCVSPLCLGAMTFGEDWGWGSSVEESTSIIDAYIERGGNFIDTANAYTKGHSEKIIGDHLGQHAAKRDRVVIATKFFTNLYPGDPNGGGANRKSIVAACEQSLRRLRTDYIDLYWMHAWDPYCPIDETMRAFDDLVRDGKIRYAGFSDTPAWKCAEAQTMALLRGWSPLIAIQIEYSLLERTVEGELVPMARELGMGIVPWAPLKGGTLSGKYKRKDAGNYEADRGTRVTSNLNDKTFALLDVIEEIARQLETTVSRVAIAWVVARRGVSSTIIGARNLIQLSDNIGATDVKLSPEMISKLDDLTAPILNFPAAFLNFIPTISRGGMTINGNAAPEWPMAPRGDSDRY